MRQVFDKCRAAVSTTALFCIVVAHPALAAPAPVGELKQWPVQRPDTTTALTLAFKFLQENTHVAAVTGARLTDAGLELNWIGAHGWSLNSALEGPIGDTPDAVGRRDFVRAWFRVRKEF